MLVAMLQNNVALMCSKPKSWNFYSGLPHQITNCCLTAAIVIFFYQCAENSDKAPHYEKNWENTKH